MSTVIWAAVAVVIIIAIVLFVYLQSIGFTVSIFETDGKGKVSSPFKFVMLSDMHEATVGKDNSELLAAIREIDPDFIILGGDMLTCSECNLKDDERVYEFLGTLSAEYKIYYGMGNHEDKIKCSEALHMHERYESLLHNLERLNITLLDNKSAYINEKNVRIYGLNLPIEYFRRFKTNPLPKGYINKVFGEVSHDDYTILIAHNPEHFDEYDNYGADLVLSGHIHGGIVRLPFLGGVISPQIKLFPKYDSGEFHGFNSDMIVSRGIGWHSVPIRIWNKAEVVVVNVR